MKLRAALLAVLLGSLAASPPASAAAAADYTVHEWGTFTSIQGSDGTPLAWNPFQTSDLPSFVFERPAPTHNPGLRARYAFQFLALNAKNAGAWLQRMETPVLYFYSTDERIVDVTVRFPLGLLTEWFPQVTRFGPVFDLDDVLPKEADSQLTWSGVRVLSRRASTNLTLIDSLPSTSEPSHYYPARRTLANLVEPTRPFAAEKQTQRDRLLFYRGAGNFAAPLRVGIPEPSTVRLANIGPEPIGPLYLVHTAGPKTSYVPLGMLAPEATLDTPLPAAGSPIGAIPERDSLSGALRDSLVHAGLFPEEADAMLATWNDSWFAEDGVRVLYLLPSAWTDRTLPLDLQPPPRNLVRVMVGRADVLKPSVERQVADLAQSWFRGGGKAVLPEFHQLGLGRFLEPALTRAGTLLHEDQVRKAFGCGAVARPEIEPLFSLPELEQSFVPDDWKRQIAMLKVNVTSAASRKRSAP